MIDRLAVYRTIDKRDRIGLLGVFNSLVDQGCERWEALAWVYWIAPSHIQKRIAELTR